MSDEESVIGRLRNERDQLRAQLDEVSRANLNWASKHAALSQQLATLRAAASRYRACVQLLVVAQSEYAATPSGWNAAGVERAAINEHEAEVALEAQLSSGGDVEPRKERCVRCGIMTSDWVDPDWAIGRVCKTCEMIHDTSMETAADTREDSGTVHPPSAGNPINIEIEQNACTEMNVTMKPHQSDLGPTCRDCGNTYDPHWNKALKIKLGRTPTPTPVCASCAWRCLERFLSEPDPSSTGDIQLTENKDVHDN